MARFVLAHPDPRAPAVREARSLAVDPEHPVARRVAAQAHRDLLVLERTVRTRPASCAPSSRSMRCAARSSFFGSTAGRGRLARLHRRCGRRVAIPQAPTRCSRCWRSRRAALAVPAGQPCAGPRCCRPSARAAGGSTLRPLDARRRRARRGRRDRRAAADDADVQRPRPRADGSVGRALALLDGDALALRQRVDDAARRSCRRSIRARCMRSAIALAGTDPAPLAAFVDTVSDWLSARLAAAGRQDRARACAGGGGVGARSTAPRADVETYNLERKPLVFSCLRLLAEAARG